ncbi:MAG: hypothetical protein KKA28_16930 [Planctomycetes bacterium]|nr:hypothetical protein [Planctomycetota bacterium]MCG2682202.1 hypothetical protein [Planctomycetales bacterium]
MTTKTADGKGRVTLGSRFANQTVIVEDVDATEVRITLAQVIPQREVWLHKNPKAKASVLRGLEQAKAGKKAKSPPDLETDARLAEQLDD